MFDRVHWYPRSISAATSQQPELCSWYQLIANVQSSVTTLALQPHARPTIFVVFGDPAPPLPRQRLRSQFSQSSTPYVILLPRQLFPRFAQSLASQQIAVNTHPAVSRGSASASGRELETQYLKPLEQP